MPTYKEFILIAKSSKNPDAKRRGAMLKLIMKEISGDNGKALAETIEAKDLEKFKSLWGNATSSIIAKLEKQFKEGSNEQSGS